VEEADLEHVVDSEQHLGEVKGLAHEVAGAGLQRAQLVIGLRGDDEHRQPGPPLEVFQVLHDLEAVHDRHVEVEQDERVAVCEVQLADPSGVCRGGDRGVARPAEHLLEQEHVGWLIINDEDLASEDVGCGHHDARPL
jgi:hypothetical protein